MHRLDELIGHLLGEVRMHGLVAADEADQEIRVLLRHGPRFHVLGHEGGFELRIHLVDRPLLDGNIVDLLARGLKLAQRPGDQVEGLARLGAEAGDGDIGGAVDQLLGQRARGHVPDVRVVRRDPIGVLENEARIDAPVALSPQAQRDPLTLDVGDGLDARVGGHEELALGPVGLAVQELELDRDGLGQELLELRCATLDRELDDHVLGAEDRGLPALFVRHGPHVVHVAGRFLGCDHERFPALGHHGTEDRVAGDHAAAKGAAQDGNDGGFARGMGRRADRPDQQNGERAHKGTQDSSSQHGSSLPGTSAMELVDMPSPACGACF